VSGVWHALLLVGIGVAAGAAFVNLLWLLREMVDLITAGDLKEPHLWPDSRSVTVWTGTDWFTVTVMPVAFGRWGVAVCRDDAPRRAETFELVGRLRGEREARGAALLLVREILNGGLARDVGVLVRAQ
jgi:hypothetical protein